MPYHAIPGLNLEYALITFDERGLERTDDPTGGPFSLQVKNDIQRKAPSDVFLFSHGWQGDVPSAVDQYNRWIGAMWKLDSDRLAMGKDFRPLFIGLHWPSRPWGEEGLASAAASFAAS